MKSTEFVRARIEPALKIEAENVLLELGITPIQAIKMLYKRLARDHKWPLKILIMALIWLIVSI